MRLIATTKLGLEAVVARELHELGFADTESLDARVSFDADAAGLCRALLYLRTAERLLLELKRFPATSFEALFTGVNEMDWKPYLPRDARIHVNGKSAKSTLFSVSDCQSIAKKAIVENLKRAYKTDVIPESGSEVVVEIGLLRDTASITLDCCGAGLSRRGYRTYNVTAPLSETLGAAIVLLSRYRAERPFIDPMCGSGTMPIEAAMIAQNRAPGINRPFAAEKWSFLPERCFALAREAARDNVRDVPLDILGSDIDARCIDVCKLHAKKAGVQVNWAVRPLSELESAAHGGVIVCNPPYGERLLDRKSADALYAQMRARFDLLPDWTKSIFSGNRDFERSYGKRADKRRKLSNGGLSCQLYQYFPQRD